MVRVTILMDLGMDKFEASIFLNDLAPDISPDTCTDLTEKGCLLT
jgi:hypothetical protein